MNIKKIVSNLFVLLFCAAVHAQDEITVKTFKELTSDLSARTSRRYDMNDEPCALIKIQYPKEGASFEGTVVGEAEFRNGEYWVYVSGGTKRIRLHLPETPTITVEFSDFGIKQAEQNMTYVIEFRFPRQGGKLPISFYAEGGFVAGGMMGAELSLGTYLGGFNLEANAMLPFGATDALYWNNPAKPSVKCSYKPVFLAGGRLGYGIRIGEKFRITPQVGMMFMKTAETVSGSNPSSHASGSFCSSVVAAAKVQFFVTKNLAIALAPEYAIPVMKSEGFNKLADQSSKIAKWNNGIGAKVALSFEF